MDRKKRMAIVAAFGAALASGQAWSATGNNLVRWLPSYNKEVANWESGMYLGFVSGISGVTNGVLFCAPNATNGQSAAIVAKFLKNNPERWGEDGGLLVIEALKNAYPKCKET